jgi:hypothetical protein
LLKRVEDMQADNQMQIEALKAKMHPSLTASDLKPYQAQRNIYDSQREQLKVLLERMNVFQKLFTFTFENHKFDPGTRLRLFLNSLDWVLLGLPTYDVCSRYAEVDLYLVDICELQFQHWLQQLQLQAAEPARRHSYTTATPQVRCGVAKWRRLVSMWLMFLLLLLHADDSSSPSDGGAALPVPKGQSSARSHQAFTSRPQRRPNARDAARVSGVSADALSTPASGASHRCSGPDWASPAA